MDLLVILCPQSGHFKRRLYVFTQVVVVVSTILGMIDHQLSYKCHSVYYRLFIIITKVSQHQPIPSASEPLP